jgi:hypothetical protein
MSAESSAVHANASVERGVMDLLSVAPGCPSYLHEHPGCEGRVIVWR